MRSILVLLSVLVFMLAPAQAETPYDGLKLVGIGKVYSDDQGANLNMFAGLTKYQDHVVGMKFTQNGTEVRYYMDAARWDNMKQLLIKARDQWATIQSRDFDVLGPIAGYRIANRVANVRFSLMGATSLDTKQLLMSANGGIDSPKRVSIHLGQAQVKSLVEEFYKVDGWFANPNQP